MPSVEEAAGLPPLMPISSKCESLRNIWKYCSATNVILVEVSIHERLSVGIT